MAYDDLNYLWDDSEDWALCQCHHARVAVTIAFAAGQASLREIAALRQLRDEWRDLPTAQVKALLQNKAEVELGLYDSLEGHNLRQRAAALGLCAVLSDASTTSYAIINRSTGSYLLIEDDDEHDYAVQQMLKAGRRIVDIAEIG